MTPVGGLQAVTANGTSLRLQFYRTLDADDAAATAGSEEGAATILLHNVHQMPGTDEEVYAGVMRDHHPAPNASLRDTPARGAGPALPSRESAVLLSLCSRRAGRLARILPDQGRQGGVVTPTDGRNFSSILLSSVLIACR